MEILPAIDIRNGKCVRLSQGNYAKETQYYDNPVEVAEKWFLEGAEILHIVDLDGAKDGKPRILETVKKIVKKTRLPIQVGGGIRTFEAAEALFDAGATRIILGTIAVEKPEILEKILHIFRKNVVVSLDVRNGELLTRGWLDNSKKNIFETAQELAAKGVQRIICTDTSRDGMLTGPNLEIYKKMIEKTEINIIAAGGIGNISHIEKLKGIGCAGVIIGKALYENKISLKEVMNIQW